MGHVKIFILERVPIYADISSDISLEINKQIIQKDSITDTDVMNQRNFTGVEFEMRLEGFLSHIRTAHVHQCCGDGAGVVWSQSMKW